MNALAILLRLFLIDVNRVSLSDAEVRKDVLEHLVGGDFAEDVGEVVDGLAGVLRYQIGGGVVGQTAAGAGYAVQCPVDCFVMPYVGDYNLVSAGAEFRCGIY